MTSPFDRIAALGVVPVIAIEEARHAVPLADALLEGGLDVAEITFRTAAAAEVLTILAAERPALLIGAGTVLDLASLEAARKAGARFGLAPGFDAEFVEAASAANLPFAPGVMTPTDLTAAVKRGVRLAKFFPAGLRAVPPPSKALPRPSPISASSSCRREASASTPWPTG